MAMPVSPPPAHQNCHPYMRNNSQKPSPDLDRNSRKFPLKIRGCLALARRGMCTRGQAWHSVRRLSKVQLSRTHPSSL